MPATAYAPGQDYSPKAGYDDPAFQGLPRANVRPPGYFDPNEFETVADVPVFAEHETVAQNGRPLRYGREELSALVERNNRRIAETGDYTAVTIGHTPGPQEKARGAPDPELVGFAGPYRLGIIGEPGQRQRYAILADMHYFRADLDKVRKHPRRSPELWLEDRYEDQFFDPIALLGAEAPRLDMGLLYAARVHNRIVEKYAAACPASGNVFVPSDSIRKDYDATGRTPEGFKRVSDDSLRHAYSADGGQPSEGYGMISPEDVKVIVDAVSQLPVFQWAQSQMGGSPGMPGAGAGGAPPMAGHIPPAPGGAPPMGAPPAAHPAPHPLAAQPMPPAAPAAPPAAPHPAPAAPAAAAAPPPAAPPAAPHPPAAGPGPGAPPAPAAGPPKPAGGPPAPSANGSKPPEANKPAGPSGDAKPEPKDDDPEKKKMQAQYSADGGNADGDYGAAEDLEGETIDHELGNAKAKYAAADDMFDDEDDFAKYAAYRKSRYAAGSADGPDSPAPANASVEGNDGDPPPGEVVGKNGSGEAATSYGGTGENIAVKYSRLAGTVEKYGRELASVRKELETERAKRIDAERQAELVDLRLNGHLISPEKLMPKLCYSKIRDEAQYRETLDMILESGARVPMNGLPYIPDSEPLVRGGETGITREKFSKEHSDRARQICESLATSGQDVDYVAVLRDVQAGKR